MSLLPRTQEDLALAIRSSSPPGGSRILNEIVPGGTLSIEGSVNVYRADYTARLTEALGETFEAVWWALGDEGFFAVCRDYIYSHESCSYNLSDYGTEFSGFVGQHEEAEGLPFLRELAQFEWEFKRLFHAPEHEPLAADALQKLAGSSDAVLSIGTACLLFRARYAVYEVWKLRKKDPDKCSAPDVDRAQCMVAYKLAGETYVKELSAAEFETLEGLRAGRPLARVLQKVADDHPDFDSEAVARFFNSLFQAGLVCSIQTDVPGP